MPRRLFSILQSYPRTLGAVALFTTLAVLMTYPLILKMDSTLIGWIGDNIAFAWIIGWFQKALFELHRSPLVAPILNYPEGYNLSYNESTPAMVIIALPASLIGGPILGYNFSILVSFVLSGLGTYLWVRRLTNNTAASVIAGTIYAFAPYRMSHLLGHLNLMGTQWFPFYFMSLDDMLENREWSWKAIFIASMSLGLIGLTSQYYLYMTLLISVVYFLGYILFVEHKPLFRFGFWKQFGVFLLIAIPLLILAVQPYLQLAGQEPLVHTFEEVRQWSASPTDFILPSPKHSIWGAWIELNFDRSLWVENTLYVGVITFIFASLALIKRKGISVSDGKVVLLAFMGLVAFVLALGTDLHWLGKPVSIDIPTLIQPLIPYQIDFIPLPGALLFKYLPFYAGMRVWMRYGIFVILFLSVLAGIGIVWLLERVRSNFRTPLAILLWLLVLIDFYPGSQPLTLVEARPIDNWLAAQPGSGAVAQFPFWQVKAPQHTYYTLIHNKPFISDPFSAFITPQFQRIAPVLSSFPNQNSVELMRDLGVQWVIVDSTQYEDYAQVHSTIETSGLEFAVEINGQYVYELK